jgi:hypothetical protein
MAGACVSPCASRLADPLRSLQPLLDPLGEPTDIGAGLDQQRRLGSG